MSSELVTQALFISAFGMAVVVAVLAVLWGFMTVLVRVTADAAPTPLAPNADASAADALEPARNRRVQAAAAAVAVALALDTTQESTRQVAPPPISPWQATLRGNVLSRRAGAFRRQPPAPRSDQ